MRRTRIEKGRGSMIGGVCERIKRGRIQEEGSEKKKKKIRNKNEKQRIKNIEVVDPIDLRKKLLYQFYILKNCMLIFIF